MGRPHDCQCANLSVMGVWLAHTSAFLAARAFSADEASALLAATWVAASSAAPDASARTRFSSSSALRLAASATCNTDYSLSPSSRHKHPMRIC